MIFNTIKLFCKKLYKYYLIFHGFSEYGAIEWIENKHNYKQALKNYNLKLYKLYKRYLTLEPISGKYNKLVCDRLTLQYILGNEKDYMMGCLFQIIKRNGSFVIIELSADHKYRKVCPKRVIEEISKKRELIIFNDVGELTQEKIDVLAFDGDTFFINNNEASERDVENYIEKIEDTYVIADPVDLSRIITVIMIHEYGQAAYVATSYIKKGNETSNWYWKKIENISYEIADALKELEFFGLDFAIGQGKIKLIGLNSHPSFLDNLEQIYYLRDFILKSYREKMHETDIRKRFFGTAKSIYSDIAQKRGYMGFMMKNWQRDLIKDWFFKKTTFKEKVWAHNRGFLSFRIAQYNMHEKNFKDFLSDREYRKLRPLNNRFVVWVYDKVITRYILDSKKKFLPEYYFHLIYKNNKLYVLPLCDAPEGYRADFAGIIHFLSWKKCIIVKPSEGSHGKGVLKLEFHDGTYFINHKEASLEELISRLSSLKGNFNITEYITMHQSLQRIYNGATYTIRIMVINKTGSDPWIANAYMRIATSSTGVTDNISDGGICARINRETGEFYGGEQMKDHIVSPCEFHPDTGNAIKGFIPHWKEIKYEIEEICRYIYQLEYMGFDVVVTENSFKILEINTHQDLHRYPYYDSGVHSYFLSKR